jgi:hypothetical protein
LRDACLGADDALLHGDLADQEGMSDLPDGKARHNAQRQRDLLGIRQLRVAAYEEEAQDVVAVVRSVEPLRQLRLGVLEVGDSFVRRQGILLTAPANTIEHRIAAHQDQPGRGIARRSVLRPALEGAQTSFLEGFLGCIQIAEIAQQSTDCLRPGGRQGRVDPGDLGHAPALLRLSGL